MSNLDKFKAIANTFSGDYHPDPNWNGATFEWLKKNTSSNGTSKAGAKCLFEFLCDNGFNVKQGGGSKALLYVENHSIIVRVATINTGGTFIFNQLRDNDAKLVFCVGVSYEDVYMWVAANHEVQLLSDQQHSEDMRWEHFTPGRAPHSAFKPTDGSIEKICDALRNEINIP